MSGIYALRCQCATPFSCCQTEQGCSFPRACTLSQTCTRKTVTFCANPLIKTQAEQDALEKKGAALKKKETELQAREAKLERMLADVAKQRDLIKSADKELKEQEEAFRQQQLAAQVVRVQKERLRADVLLVFLVLWA